MRTEECELLDLLAEKHGKSRGECARELVVTHLSGGANERLAKVEDRLAQLQEAVRIVDSNQRISTQVLLCDAGRAEVSEAEQFVREHLD